MPLSGSSSLPAWSFSARDLSQLIMLFRDALRSNQPALNALNVYPVPDGDTGTNMALTLVSVAAELDGIDLDDMAAVCHAISHGSLMGARGNSGVILSQILRGLASVCREYTAVGPVELAKALAAASAGAYAAVMKPVEGTILTVVRAASEGASDAAGQGKDLIGVFQAASEHAKAALASTPDLLPALKAAGVVDAGGAGLCLLIDAALLLFTGQEIAPVVGPVGAGPSGLGTPTRRATDASVRGDTSDGIAGLRYEVMYFLEADDMAIAGFKDVWAGLGDSIVVVGGDGVWNCHIHTDNIGATIEAAVDIGRPRKIRVTDLFEQVEELEEERWVRDATAAGALDTVPARSNDPCTTAVVAVATGDGIKRLFWSLGVQQVVTGGQSMNPSTQQLLDAVESCPAEAVMILPNNKNIIAVAEQVAPLTAKSVRVIATRGVTEGLAAAVQYDPAGSVDANAKAMRSAIANVVSGEVTTAVRASSSDVGPIAAGDHLGITREGGIVVVAAELGSTCTQLLEKIVDDEHEIVTVIEGEGSSVGVTRQITQWLETHRPSMIAEVHHGGQPLYPYLFGIE